MPPKVSTNCTMTWAIVSRVCRYATADSRRNQAVSQISGPKPASTTRASGQSSSNIPAPTSSSEKTADTSESRPSSNRSEMESMSETWREMTRPEV
jgi:hypothetical protein